MGSLLFSTFEVTKQVFFRTATTAAFVNIKPMIPGHVLVIPSRVVPRFADLSASEVSSLFTSVQTVGRVIEKAYNADGLTIACQDGEAAGQSVPHVHVHILPRKLIGDKFSKKDDIYPAMEANKEMIAYEDAKQALSEPTRKVENQALKMDNDERKPRSVEEMQAEAEWLKGFFNELDEQVGGNSTTL